MGKKADKTEIKIKKLLNTSMKTMIEKNRERGDCWRSVGLLGSFLEIRSMFYRLRNLLWSNGKIVSVLRHSLSLQQKQAIQNSLEDLRNFCILAELSLEEDNMCGENYEEE